MAYFAKSTYYTFLRLFNSTSGGKIVLLPLPLFKKQLNKWDFTATAFENGFL